MTLPSSKDATKRIGFGLFSLNPLAFLVFVLMTDALMTLRSFQHGSFRLLDLRPSTVTGRNR